MYEPLLFVATHECGSKAGDRYEINISAPSPATEEIVE
jgi:hypothetical protein